MNQNRGAVAPIGTHYEGTNSAVICSTIFDTLPDFLEELKKL